MIKDWELFRIFVVVARAGSFRKAQDILGLKPQTISAKIDALEEQMGSLLFFRTRAGVIMTDVGQEFFQVAAQMERITQNIAPIKAIQEKRHLRIAATDGIGGFWLLKALPAFVKEFPSIRIETQYIDWCQSIDLTKAEVDLTATYAAPTDPDAVILAHAPVTLAPFATKAFLKRHGTPRNFDDLRRFPLCVHDMQYDKSNPTVRPWTEMLETHPNIIYRTGSSLALRHAAKWGLGISLQPITGIDTDPDDAVMLDFFTCTYELYVVSHYSMKDYPPIRMLIDLFKKYLLRDADGSLTKRPRESAVARTRAPAVRAGSRRRSGT